MKKLIFEIKYFSIVYLLTFSYVCVNQRKDMNKMILNNNWWWSLQLSKDVSQVVM